jgi:RNA polymerase sigma-54 factor
MIHPTYELEQRLDQNLTHQQIQDLEILATPQCSLQTLIACEVQKNPLLDMNEQSEHSEMPEEADASADNDDDDWIDDLIRIDDETPVFQRPILRVSDEEEERRRHYFESVTSNKTLQEDLLEQLHFLELSPEQGELCELIVSSVDNNGYCHLHPADLAMTLEQSLDAIESALCTVQSLEPAGVAARDLRERLLIQMERGEMTDTLAYQVVHDHFDDLAGNRLPSLARKLHTNLHAFEQVMSTIRNLEPVLHTNESVRESEYVEEDAFIEQVGERLKARVNDDHIPTLRINPHYKRLLADPATPDETKDYVKQKIRSATYLMYSLEHRKKTLDRILDVIVNVQEDYFKRGSDHLKPLTMGAVADRVGVHETTVSRAVADKYIRCDHGLVPMRQFFSHGLEVAQGQTVSNTVIKCQVREIVEQEDLNAPLSDNQIADALKVRGYRIARRTVAKYRESMRILSRNKRRRYV